MWFPSRRVPCVRVCLGANVCVRQAYEVCWLTKLQVAGMRETVRKSAVWRRYSQFKALDQCVVPHSVDALL